MKRKSPTIIDDDLFLVLILSISVKLPVFHILVLNFSQSYFRAVTSYVIQKRRCTCVHNNHYL